MTRQIGFNLDNRPKKPCGTLISEPLLSKVAKEISQLAFISLWAFRFWFTPTLLQLIERLMMY